MPRRCSPLRTLPAGFEPTGIAFDGRGTLYVANRLSDDVAVVDLPAAPSRAA
jgi:DNA-binding beta-propeller fold protein YncE